MARAVNMSAGVDRPVMLWPSFRFFFLSCMTLTELGMCGECCAREGLGLLLYYVYITVSSSPVFSR